MLEGKLKIELTDVKTGEKEVHEQHNLVTDNVQFLLNSVPAGEVLPMNTKGMGNLLLFDAEITENSGNHLVGLPKDAKLVGYADRSVDLTNNYKGSFNTAESSGTADSYTNVWDFSTSQLNGSIGALALTSTINPFIRRNGQGNRIRNITETQVTLTEEIDGTTYTKIVNCPDSCSQPLYYDPDTNYLYFIQYVRFNYGTGGGETIQIIFGRYRYIMKYGVVESAYSTSPAEVISVIKDTGLEVVCQNATDPTAAAKTIVLSQLNQLSWYGTKDGYAYVVGTIHGISAYDTLFWIKYKVYDGTLTFIEAKYNTYENVNFAPSIHYYSYSNRTGYYNQLYRYGSYAALCDDKFFIAKGDPTNDATPFEGYYLIDKEDLTDIQEYNTPIPLKNNGRTGIAIWPNGIIHTSGMNIYTDGTTSIGSQETSYGSDADVPTTDANSSSFLPYNCPFAHFQHKCETPSYLLSTICNLSNVVNKTSAVTMKVTYTISTYLDMYFTSYPQDTSGVTGSTIELSVAVANGSHTYSYQWQVSSDQTTWTNCSETSATTDTLELTLSSSNTDKYYRCVVTDSLNQSITSISALVTLAT